MNENSKPSETILHINENIKECVKLIATDIADAQEAQPGVSQKQVIAIQEFLDNFALDLVIMYPDNTKAIIKNISGREVTVHGETGKALPQVNPGDAFTFLKLSYFEEKVVDTKNAAGQSEVHQDSMSEKHGDEKRPEKGFNKLTEENENALPPVAEMTSGKTDHNAAGESKSKIDRETSTELPH